MIYFSAYAEQKFAVLNRHGVFIRKEQVEDALNAPALRGKIGRCLSAEKDGVKVIYSKEGELKKVITFYPL
mgnify:CR=1 FL=1